MHTAIVVTLLAANLVPGSELADRLATLEARREAVEVTHTRATATRVFAAVGYAGAAASVIWFMVVNANNATSLARSVTGRSSSPLQDPVAPVIAGFSSLAFAVVMHITTTVLGNSADEETDLLEAEATALRRARTVAREAPGQLIVPPPPPYAE